MKIALITDDLFQGVRRMVSTSSDLVEWVNDVGSFVVPAYDLSQLFFSVASLKTVVLGFRGVTVYHVSKQELVKWSRGRVVDSLQGFERKFNIADRITSFFILSTMASLLVLLMCSIGELAGYKSTVLQFSLLATAWFASTLNLIWKDRTPPAPSPIVLP